ncbi:unnamed protein product [Onchocerca flexuosa]|uniref:NBD_C domain-containing protein n=1 Tax=Onchocerca flexuosa TaxID=387005 RepID=A0A183HYY9_9BILA|nr:unnamed protein product [Onchocerca flexuosa]
MVGKARVGSTAVITTNVDNVRQGIAAVFHTTVMNNLKESIDNPCSPPPTQAAGRLLIGQESVLKSL